MPRERQALLENAPRFDLIAAARIASAFVSGVSRVEPLPSERDQNFLVDSGESRSVLKIANALESVDLIDAQQRVLGHLLSRFDRCPRVIPALDGSTMLQFDGVGGRKHTVWAVSVLQGIPLARVGWRSKALLEDFGRTIGDLSTALAAFDHPAIHREFLWDLTHGFETIEQFRPLVLDRDLGACIDALRDRVDRCARPHFGRLRPGPVHNDLNDHNVLVGRGTDPFTRNQCVTGIVDFGDMIHGFVAADVAIAAAYASLDAADPLDVAAGIIAGFHARFPLDDDEFSVLFGLIVLRLCTSVCIAARQMSERPDNEYLEVSQAPIRRTLPLLLETPFGLAEAVFRRACGLDPSPGGTRVEAWLRGRGPTFHPVLDLDLRSRPFSIVPLGPESPLLLGDTSSNPEPALTARIEQLMREEGTQVGIGLYDEARLLYDTGPFEPADHPEAERRMVHLGIDLFAEPGTPVHSPMAGVIHDFGDNAQPRDYGPVILLRHETDDHVSFFTIFGHLARASLDGLHPGRRVEAGERIGWIGDASVNGGWTPHLHLQIIADPAADRAWPGIGRASRRGAWTRLCPDPNLVLGLPPERLPPRPAPDSATLDLRRRVLGPAVRLAYRSPVRLVRGWMQYLWDASARRYLDGYNNVPHVGHAHPRVVEAAARQMALLNTNTRYLSDTVNRYAGRLSALFPEPLNVVFFVNSGSEANELALRLARTHTGRDDMVVLEAAYHGNTTAAIDMSPYKHAGPGGNGPPEWVHAVPLPDDYRGMYRRADPDRARKYAQHVDEVIARLARDGRGPAGFIAETFPSVGGQILPPPGYFGEVYGRVRAAGGVCIADEVQTGFGRTGDWFWAFEAHDVVPDIVVLGKPMGNGYPIGAVITTRAIAASFDNGMEFFSTFGGNTVSCAIGESVLDVIRDESLQAHAREVGGLLLDGLRDLALDHPFVGDVRGSGLFAGVELVRDPGTLEPAAAEAAFVVERLRDCGILVGTDGTFHNVIKIRPPMPFNGRDAERLVETMDRILRRELA
jgi:4-aminobutyrate aminotransferase-like enzyme/Ser/Thr protein kinase RdoA (MazF antagonist)